MYAPSVAMQFFVDDFNAIGTFIVKETNATEIYTNEYRSYSNPAHASWNANSRCLNYAAWHGLSNTPPGFGTCPQYDNNSVQSINLNLLPHLKPGSNTVIFANGYIYGGLWAMGATTPRKLVIEYKPGCRIKLQCTDNWQNGCAELEQRAM